MDLSSCTQTTIGERKTNEILIVVLVAQRGAGGIQDIPNLDVGVHSIHVDNRIECERVAAMVVAVNLSEPIRVLLLPKAITTVASAMVRPEERLTWRSLDICHDTSDSIVAPAVGTFLRAIIETSVVRVRTAGIEISLAAVLCRATVTITT